MEIRDDQHAERLDRVTRENRYLRVSVLVLFAIASILFSRADRPGLFVYDEILLRWDNGIFSGSLGEVYVYRSEELQELAIGVFVDHPQRPYLFDIAIVHYVSGVDEVLSLKSRSSREEIEADLRRWGLLE